ncbi:hypothetical protein B2G74_27325 [Burkholderia sp. A27]|nr:hypothetical protein B2G74_27325 [Burkholderia sp. A27]
MIGDPKKTDALGDTDGYVRPRILGMRNFRESQTKQVSRIVNTETGFTSYWRIKMSFNNSTTLNYYQMISS